jgi:hypothetical protein
MSRIKMAGIGESLLNHGEKIAFAVLAAFAVLLIWWGIGAESVSPSQRPEDLEKLARAAGDNIVRVENVPADRVPERRPMAPRVEPWRPQQVKIAAAPQTPTLFDRPLFAELTKRSKPEVFPIESLRAVAGVAVLPDPAAAVGGGGMFQPPGMIRPSLPPEPVPERPGRGPGRRPRGRPGDRGDDGTLFGGFGPLAPEPEAALTPEQPQEPGKVTPFVVVTGLIPAARQIAEYESRFGSASFRDSERDYPRWAVYLVERARVVPGGSPTWQRLEIENVERTEPGGMGRVPMVPGPGGELDGEAGSPLAQELVPPFFLLQPQETEIGYAAAAPERIDRPWGTILVHPWFIPKLEDYLDSNPDEEEDLPPPEPVSLADLVANPDDFIDKRLRIEGVVLEADPRRQQEIRLYRVGVRSDDGGQRIAADPIGRGKKPVCAISEAFGRDLSISGVSADDQSADVVVRVDRMGPTPVIRILSIELRNDGGGAARSLVDPAPEPIRDAGFGGMAGEGGPMMGLNPDMPLSEMRLFRFVDTKVTPGETYQYRVRFALRNPNVGLAPRYLSDPAAARGEFLLSDYSQPTPPVRVSEPTALAARTIPKDVARKMKLRGDTVEVMVLGPSEESGNLALRSVVTEPGGLADVDMALNSPGNTRFYGETVTTDRILLDVHGPQDERADLRTRMPPPPLEMLFLRPDGSFEFVSAADMEPRVEQYAATLFKSGTKEPDDGKSDRRESNRDRDPQPRRGR